MELHHPPIDLNLYKLFLDGFLANNNLEDITSLTLYYPADIMGEDYPSETFRVLKKNEIREFGEYHTQRLVLAAWDQLESGELH